MDNKIKPSTKKFLSKLDEVASIEAVQRGEMLRIEELEGKTCRDIVEESIDLYLKIWTMVVKRGGKMILLDENGKLSRLLFDPRLPNRVLLETNAMDADKAHDRKISDLELIESVGVRNSPEYSEYEVADHFEFDTSARWRDGG